MKQLGILAFAFAVGAVLSCAITLATRSPIWIMEKDGRVAVVAKTSDGKLFNILIFDRKLLDESSSLTGIDMSAEKEKIDGRNSPL